MKCLFSTGDALADGRVEVTCSRCGRVVKCRPRLADRVNAECHGQPGLGDYVAGMLAAVGISSSRISRMLGRPCGCSKRQAWLNRMGRPLTHRGVAR